MDYEIHVYISKQLSNKYGGTWVRTGDTNLLYTDGTRQARITSETLKPLTFELVNDGGAQ